MKFNEFQGKARETAIYEDSVVHMTAQLTQNQMNSALCLIYPALKLNGEAGEIAEEVGKMIRDDHGVLTMDRADRLRKEVGDILWYAAALATELDMQLETVAIDNIAKLSSRQERGVLRGSGDDR